MAKKKIILGSKSPRRQELAKQLGLEIEIRTVEVEEVYPSTLDSNEVALYLSELKAQPLLATLKENEILITSDTTVVLNNHLMGKPRDREEAIGMLQSLSNKSHLVITGVFMADINHNIKFAHSTTVHFDQLSSAEIEYYVDNFSPYDKAGAYGIQEWIGYVAIKGIEGCYYNVMGLPVHDVYAQMKNSFL